MGEEKRQLYARIATANDIAREQNFKPIDPNHLAIEEVSSEGGVRQGNNIIGYNAETDTIQILYYSGPATYIYIE